MVYILPCHLISVKGYETINSNNAATKTAMSSFMMLTRSFLFFARLKYIIFQSLYWTIIFNSIFIVFCPFRLYIILSMNSAPKWDYWRKYCSPSFLYNFNKSSLRQFWETFCIPLNPLYYQQHKLFSTASNQSNT